MQYSDGKLVLAGSDGFRLSEAIIDAPKGNDPFSIILPARTLLEAARILSSCDEKMNMYVDANKNVCLFECEDILIETRLIDGNYPDYKRIIPTEVLLSASFNASDLLEAVKLTHVFVKGSDDSAIKLVIGPEGIIRVGASSSDIGRNDSELKAEIKSDLDSPFEIIFNASYLLELLTSSKYENLVFHASSNASPCLITPQDEEGFLHVMAPMQVND